ncbi:MAG: response regulator [Clostridiales bacterium]|nr:response regulator [Clostridiales bacterium]
MIRVVVVEDEAMVRRGIIQTLDWASIDCIVIGEASNGEQGMDLIRELRPELIITDVRMPRVDGVTMIKQLRSEGCKAKFILLTAYSDFGYAQSAIRAGASDYLLKPLKDGELEATIKRIFLSEDKGNLPKPDKDLPPIQFQFNPRENVSNKFIIQALQYIKSHYQKDITISLVADYLGISEGYLSRVFKKETGYTFTNYLTYYRIRSACMLLKNCRAKIYQVASDVGYPDTAYFSTLFKKLTGVSPSEYQDRIVANPNS